MKNLLLLAVSTFVVGVCVFLVTCSSGEKDNLIPLSGSDPLAIFSQIQENGTVLTGVLDQETKDIIVPPSTYTNITADQNVIICTEENNTYTMFCKNGSELGNFDMITPWVKADQGNYYYCVKYTTQTYYFPEQDYLISTQNSHHELKVIFIENPDIWRVLDYKGNTLSILPNKFTVIKDEKRPEEMYIAVVTEEENGPICTLYSPEGKMYKELTMKQWKRIERRLKLEKNLNDSAKITTTKEFEKI